MADTEQLPNECAVCLTPCVEMYCSQDCYLVGTGKGFSCVTCNAVLPKTQTYRIEKYCSRTCANTAAIKHTLLTCSECSKTVRVSGTRLAKVRYRLTKGSKFYCSSTCITLSARGDSTPDCVPCCVCGKELSLAHGLKPSDEEYRARSIRRTKVRKGAAIYCSSACAGKNRLKKYTDENPTTQP